MLNVPMYGKNLIEVMLKKKIPTYGNFRIRVGTCSFGGTGYTQYLAALRCQGSSRMEITVVAYIFRT